MAHVTIELWAKRSRYRKTLAAAGRPDLEVIVEGTATHEIREQWLDSTRARKELNWTPLYGFEMGLAQTARWYEAYLGRADVKASSGEVT